MDAKYTNTANAYEHWVSFTVHISQTIKLYLNTDSIPVLEQLIYTYINIFNKKSTGLTNLVICFLEFQLIA